MVPEESAETFNRLSATVLSEFQTNSVTSFRLFVPLILFRLPELPRSGLWQKKMHVVTSSWDTSTKQELLSKQSHLPTSTWVRQFHQEGILLCTDQFLLATIKEKAFQVYLTFQHVITDSMFKPVLPQYSGLFVFFFGGGGGNYGTFVVKHKTLILFILLSHSLFIFPCSYHVNTLSDSLTGWNLFWFQLMMNLSGTLDKKIPADQS